MRRLGTDGEARVVIEERGSDVGTFLFGVALGAGVALLMAPRTGEQTRAVLRRNAESARVRAQGVVEQVADRVSGSFAEAREEVERRIATARNAVAERSREVSEAVAAGRSAARSARSELKGRLSTTDADAKADHSDS
jgi:gas vesicle protein